MCATADQSQLEQQQQDAYTQALSLAQKQYGSQQDIFGSMQSILQPILQKGPSQEGFSPEERNDLETQATEGTTENYKNAAQAVGEASAARGGGSLPMEGGPETQTREELATSAADTLSKQQSGIVQADYDQGNKNWLTALQGVGNIASEENPLGYESSATNEGNSADSEANTIATEDNSWINATIGAAGSLGSGWATGGFKH